MLRLLILLSAVPHACAMTLDALGRGLGGKAPGIAQMWDRLTSLFPYSGAGSLAPGPIFTRLNTAVLTSIATVATALLAYAGTRLTMVGFSEDAIAEAKRIAKYVIIGLLAALIADMVIALAYQVFTDIANS